jgi:hypothetical protein
VPLIPPDSQHDARSQIPDRTELTVPGKLGAIDGRAAHVAAAIRACDIREQPFAHAVIDDVFPREFYGEMLHHWPRRRALRRGQFGRRGLRVPDEVDAFWRSVYFDLLATGVTREAVGRFGAHVRQGVDAKALTLRECTLVQDGFGYSIPPHSDAPHKKVLTLIFYLPRSADQRDLGTCIMRPRRIDMRPAVEEGYRWQSWKDFETVQRIEFLPNRLFVFAVNDRSFHAVQRIWRFTARRSLQAFIA